MKFSNCFIFVLVMLVGCASVYNRTDRELDRKVIYAVLPFENNTETPMAGLKVSTIVEGVMKAKGYIIANRIWEERKDDYSQKEIKGFMDSAKQQGSQYAVSGQINEWRYKTGIDGEPAVSLVLTLYDTEKGTVIWSGVVSKSGWSYESLGVITQKIVDKIID